MRYAYVKPNNAVRELHRVGLRPTTIPEGGPEAYVAHYMRLVGDQPALLISVHFFPTHKDEYFQKDNVVARSFYWYSRLLRPFGIVATRPTGTFFPRLSKSIRIFAALVRFRPDRILCWNASFVLWATFLASRVVGATFVYSRHTRILSNNAPWYQRLTRAVDIWIMRRASAVVCNGPYVKDQLVEVAVNPNCIFEFNWNFRHMLLHTDEKREGPDLTNGGQLTVILFIGRVTASKGVFDLLDACAERLRQDQCSRLVYAGDGLALDELRMRVKDQGLEDQVKFLGMVPHEELSHIIRQCKLVVTPTRGAFPEGRCMAAMEALVMGIPVIAPDSGPFPYLVKHEDNGLLFKTDSLIELEKKINHILDDDELYERLCAGARKSGSDIRAARVNFSHALAAAFAFAERREGSA